MESIVEMRQEGMSWPEIREKLGLMPECGSDRDWPETPPVGRRERG